jgi:hypothetical protein
MPTVILKKTFKIKPGGFQVAHEKSFSFHGSAVSDSIISAVNQKLAALRYSNKAKRVQFGGSASGHYFASMNHDCQKYHEEDVICGILDVMETLGWTFRFQYDSENSSARVGGTSFTSRELFIFQNTPPSSSRAQGGASFHTEMAPLAVSVPVKLNLRIAAPQDTPEGQTFQARYENHTFSVTAPAGGLVKGQVVTVPAPF